MNSSATILDRLLDPIAECLNADAAKRILEVRLDAESEARLDALRTKANEGELTETEATEYREFIESMDFIGIFKAKARKVAAKQPA
jgi:hypothetical protein